MPTLREQIAAAKQAKIAAGQVAPKKKLSLSEQIKAAKQAKIATQPPEPESTFRGRSRELLEGVSAGGAGEIGTGVAAGLVKAQQYLSEMNPLSIMRNVARGDDASDIQERATGGESFSDIQQGMQQQYEAERDVEREANPGGSLLLNVAGGLATPGGTLTSPLKLSSLPHLKGLTQLAGKAPGWIKAPAKVGLEAARNATIGYGTGYMSGRDAEEREKMAETGGMMGAVLPVALKGVMSGIGATGRQLTKQRYDSPMYDEAGNLIPLNVQAPEGSRIANWYQKILGASFGGQRLRDQNRVLLEKSLANVKDKVGTLEDVRGAGKQLNQMQMRASFNQEAAPIGTDPGDLAKIAGLKPQEANRILRDKWKESGFKVVKDRDFAIDPKQLTREIMRDLDNPADIHAAKEIGMGLRRKLKRGFTPDKAEPAAAYSLDPVSQRSVKNPMVDLDTGKIDGDWLMQARNDLAIKASKLGNEGDDVLKAEAMKKAAGKLDKLIYEQLEKESPELASQFSDDLSRWGKYRTVRDATNRAKQKGGLWEESDVINSAAKFKPRQTELGLGNFQEPAQAAQLARGVAEKEAQSAVDVADEAYSKLQKKMPVFNPTPWQQNVASKTIGNVLPGVDNTKATIAGILAGYPTSSPVTQSIIAGQWLPQRKARALSEAVRKVPRIGEVKEIIDNAPGAISRGLIMNTEQR